jgi:hypothetical protein
MDWGVKAFHMALSSPLQGLGLSYALSCAPEEIGRGGFGVVHRLRDDHQRVDLVLKTALQVRQFSGSP